MTRRNLLAALLLCFYGGIYLMGDKPNDDKDPQGGRPDAADDSQADTPAPQDPPPPPPPTPTDPDGGVIEGGKRS